MKLYSFRLTPGMDLKLELSRIAEKNSINSGFIITCVGSLKRMKIRLSDLSVLRCEENYEIVSLVGTLCCDGLHLHISLADSSGRVIGGHLLDGNIIHTTAEIVIGCDESCSFSRAFDAGTGFKELFISTEQ